MPVPVPSPENQEPRRLLRDVVYDKMWEAIIDGTLELGERLNDDELVRWLGVSRTPVREAIAKLAEQGLVDIEANRYTRVVSPTFAEFVDVVETGYALWSMFARRGVPNLSDADRDHIAQALDRRAKTMESKGRDDVMALVDINERLLAAAQSPVLTRVWGLSGPVLALLFQRTAATGIYPWKEGAEFTRAFRKAVVAKDGDRAAELLAEQPSKFAAYIDEVREAGLFPA